MFEKQDIITINKEELLNKVQTLSNENYRLAQICCTKNPDHFSLDYSFDKDNQFLDLRLSLSLENPKLPSISGIYLPAFLYENEIHDLFGVQITNIAVDFKGKFYRIEKENPFSSTEATETSKD